MFELANFLVDCKCSTVLFFLILYCSYFSSGVDAWYWYQSWR